LVGRFGFLIIVFVVGGPGGFSSARRSASELTRQAG
jgi:hypothetical protein